MAQVITVAVDAFKVLVVTAVRGVPMDTAAQGIVEEVQDIVRGAVILGWVALVQVRNSNLPQYIQWITGPILATPFGILHTLCGRFRKHQTQWDCEFQVGMLVWHF